MSEVAEGQLAHHVYFTLKDKSAEKKAELVEACHQYLKPQPGVVFFSVGGRVPDLSRNVNDDQFDVSLAIVFDSRQSHDAYQVDETHDKFVDEQKENWESVRVFDSNLA